MILKINSLYYRENVVATVYQQISAVFLKFFCSCTHTNKAVTSNRRMGDISINQNKKLVRCTYIYLRRMQSLSGMLVVP